MGNNDKRLKRLEMALTPRQEATAYIRSLMQRFDSPLEYSIWCLEDPAGESAREQLFERVQYNVLKALKDQRPDLSEINKAINEAYWDLAIRLKLFATIDEDVERTVEDTRPLYVWLFSRAQHMFHASFGEELLHRWIALPKVAAHRIFDKKAPFAVNKKNRLDSGLQHEEWEQEARRLLKTLYALRIAHDQIATDLFEGHPILWKGTREALDHQTRSAEILLGTYTNAVAIQRECLKKGVPINPRIWSMDIEWLVHVGQELETSLDEIRQEAGPIASNNLADWIETASSEVLADNGDPSGVIRLMKQEAETAKPPVPMAGNPDPGGCDRPTQNQPGHAG